MHRSLRLPLLSAVAATALLAGCGSSSPSSGQSSDGAALPEGTDYVVKDYRFPPLTLAPGQVVDVVDEDAEPHTLTAKDGSFDTGSFDAGDPGRFTAPTELGSYEFTCTIHPSMTGTLTVR